MMMMMMMMMVMVVVVVAPRRAKWDPESDKGLCGTPDNGHGLWRFTKAKLKVPTQAEAALYTILTQGVSNFPIIYPVCKLPEKSFSACPNYRRPYAIRLCSQFFAPKSAFFKCMLNNGCHAPALIFMFDHCIRYACKGIPKDCLVVQNKLALVPKCIKFAGPELGKIDCRRGIEDLPV
nr:hypothetical protein BaRGS_023426 [Batillaria attramentaria]